MKAKAHVDRWAEEKDLLQEEMRHVLEFFKWKSSWWLEQRHRRKDGEHAGVIQGLAAYAEKQAAVYYRLAAKFAGTWLPFLESRGIHPDWQSRYANPQHIARDTNLSENNSTDSNTEDSEPE